MFRVVRKLNARGFVSALASKTVQKSNTFAPVVVPVATQFRFASGVGSALAKEYKEELDHVEPNEEFLEIKQQIEKTFKIEEKAGSSVVNLTSSFKDEKIVVAFDVQDELVDEQQADFDEEGNYNEDGGEEGLTVHRFTVQVKKDTRTLVFECAAGNDVEIRNIQILKDGVEYESESTHDLYSGPNFADLDDTLRDAFYEYLNTRKVDADFSFFVRSYAHNKEQREYVNWLKSVGEFVGKE